MPKGRAAGDLLTYRGGQTKTRPKVCKTRYQAKYFGKIPVIKDGKRSIEISIQTNSVKF